MNTPVELSTKVRSLFQTILKKKTQETNEFKKQQQQQNTKHKTHSVLRNAQQFGDELNSRTVDLSSHTRLPILN